MCIAKYVPLGFMARLVYHVHQPANAATTFIYDILKENLTSKYHRVLLIPSPIQQTAVVGCKQCIPSSYKKNKLYIA